jgi:hypothetical protein
MTAEHWWKGNCGKIRQIYSKINPLQYPASNGNEYQEHFLGVKAAGA